jgi:hypothetical protein
MGTPQIKPGQTHHVNASLQLWGLLVHGLLVAFIIACTFVLAYVKVLTADSVLGIFGSALGFSGGAAAYRVGVRSTDPQRHASPDDAAG